MTEGVIVMIAAKRKLNAECIVLGRVESACMRVEYDAMMIGGRGGKSGSGANSAAELPTAGW